MFWSWRLLKEQGRNGRGEFTSGSSSLPDKFALPAKLPEGKVDWVAGIPRSGVDTEDELRGAVHSLTGMSPEHLTGILTRGTDYTATLEQGQAEPGRSVTLTWGLFDKDGKDVGGVTRSWDRSKFTGEVTVHHDLFRLAKDVQGTGLAKSVLGNMMAVYQRTGVSSVKLDAGMTVGGYAWAKFGFSPNLNSWSSLVDKMKNSALGETRSVRDKLDKLMAGGPKNIWKIADMKSASYEMPGKSVGKAMLLGKGWQGELRLDDKTGMKRFNTYVGDRVSKADVQTIAKSEMMDEAEILMSIIDEHDGE